ncbi:hypothetical protein ACFQL7_26040 [Halocatena marina]|uniref:Transposase n=1 Tax=Halocatena marina TaxID=2934937 RepID=A0ABD5YU91_9EURY
MDLVTEQADNEIVFPPERWAATFRSHTQLILHELGKYLGYSLPRRCGSHSSPFGLTECIVGKSQRFS